PALVRPVPATAARCAAATRSPTRRAAGYTAGAGDWSSRQDPFLFVTSLLRGAISKHRGHLTRLTPAPAVHTHTSGRRPVAASYRAGSSTSIPSTREASARAT